MIETSVRHPRILAMLAGLVAVVAAVSLIGPRDGSVVGVSDAGADDGQGTEVSESTSTTVTGDDGVVLTAPGELVSVIEGPTSTSTGAGEDVGIAGTPPGSSAAPSTSGPSATTGEVATPDAASTSTAAPVTSSGDAQATSTTLSPDQTTSTSEAETPVTTSTPGSGQASPTTAVDASADVVSGVPSALLSAPEMSGSTRGADGDQPATAVISQIGTRDTNSVPWMLLIAANFGISLVALAFLRLRR